MSDRKHIPHASYISSRPEHKQRPDMSFALDIAITGVMSGYGQAFGVRQSRFEDRALTKQPLRRFVGKAPWDARRHLPRGITSLPSHASPLNLLKTYLG